MTSFDEVHRLMERLNKLIVEKRCLEAFEASENLHPISVELEFLETQVPSKAQSLNHVIGEDLNDTATYSYRFATKAVMKIEFENGTGHNISGESDTCLHQIHSKISGCHNLLKEIAESGLFREEFRRECMLLFGLAYHRGHTLAMGKFYPFCESTFIEFKGGKHEGLWQFTSFKEAFNRWVVPTICGFVNRRVFDQTRPQDYCRIVFGVRNDGIIQGIRLDGSQTLRQLQDELSQTAKEALANQVVLPRGAGEDIAGAIRVQVIRLTPVPVPGSPSQEFVPVLIIVGLRFSDDFDVIHPCIVGKCETSGPESGPRFCYFRSAKPALFELEDRNQRGIYTVSVTPKGSFARAFEYIFRHDLPEGVKSTLKVDQVLAKANKQAIKSNAAISQQVSGNPLSVPCTPATASGKPGDKVSEPTPKVTATASRKPSTAGSTRKQSLATSSNQVLQDLEKRIPGEKISGATLTVSHVSKAAESFPNVTVAQASSNALGSRAAPKPKRKRGGRRRKQPQQPTVAPVPSSPSSA